MVARKVRGVQPAPPMLEYQLAYCANVTPCCYTRYASKRTSKCYLQRKELNFYIPPVYHAYDCSPQLQSWPHLYVSIYRLVSVCSITRSYINADRFITKTYLGETAVEFQSPTVMQNQLRKNRQNTYIDYFLTQAFC